MRQPPARLRIGTNLGVWLPVLTVWAGTCGLAHGQTPAGPPPDPPQSSALEERLRRVEEVNARLLEQLNRDREESTQRYGALEGRYRRDREESARRYGVLEDRYRELQRRLGEPRPAAEAEATPASGRDNHPQIAPRAARRGGPAPPHPRTPIEGPTR